MNTQAQRLGDFLRRLHTILGGPGLMMGAVAALSFVFGLYLCATAYDHPRQTGRRALHEVISQWVRTPDYLGLTLVDHVAMWREADPQNRPARRELLGQALEHLGTELNREAERFPLIEVVSLRLTTPETGTLTRWLSATPSGEPGSDVEDTVSLADAGARSPAELRLTYHLATRLAVAAHSLEVSYRRLLLGLLGLSGFSLLCIVYMVLNARALARRVACEAAQEATLDLADRTCHELGNGVFVLSNERRNLARHLDLVERFIAEETAARDAASRRAGLDSETTLRLHHALKREYAVRGIDPDLELRGSAAIARHVCHQIDVCSEYIILTVRELDGFLKRTSLPLSLAPTDLTECIDEAVALLRPRLDATGSRLTLQTPPPGALMARADRRLLIHALVNLLKNALEAAESARDSPEIELAAGSRARTAWIAVSDNGPGLPTDHLRRIFDGGYTTKGAGRGRGLAIVRESIHLQGGEIAAENLPAGGACFRIGLALEAGDS